MSKQVADPEVQGGELTRGLMTDAKLILAFMLSGDATVTFEGQTKDYTFKITKGDEPTDEQKAKGWSQAWFVGLLTGSDNEHSYTYMGLIRTNRKTGILDFFTAGRTQYNMMSPCVVAFKWAFDIFLQGRVPTTLKVWHEGTCGRCGRKLTTKQSIQDGFGPVCVELMGGMDAIKASAPMAVFAAKPAASPEAVVVQPRPQQTPAFVRPTPAQIVAEVNATIKAQPVVQPVVNTPKEVAVVVSVATGEAACSSCKRNFPQGSMVEFENVKGQFCSSCQKTAEALAKSQEGWTVADAAQALSRRRIINMNPNPANRNPSKAEEAVITAMIEGVKTAPLVDEGYDF